MVPKDEDQPLASRPILSTLAFAGGEPVTEARHVARDFLTAVQAVHGIPVSDRAMGMVQLVVSELVTNAHKDAPGPCLLDLEISDGAVEISVGHRPRRCRWPRPPIRAGSGSTAWTS